MKVNQLIEILKTMPPEAKVFHIWDGEPRTEINIVYLSKAGHVMTIDNHQPIYSKMALPEDIDSESNKTYYTPEKTNPNSYEDAWDYGL